MISQRNSFFDRINLNLVAVAVTASTWALPAVSPVFIGLQIFAPLPAFYFLVELGQRRGFTTLAMAMLLSGIVGVMVGNTEALVFTVLMLPAGLIMAREVLSRQNGPVQTGFRALLVLLLVWLLWSLFYGYSRPETPGIYGDIVTSLDTGLVEVGTTLKGNNHLEPEQALEVETAITRLRGILPRVLPGLLFTTLLNTIFLNMVVGQYFLRRKNPGLVAWPPFAAWRLPEPLVTLVIVAGFCMLMPLQIIKDIGINLLLVAGALYFFQGLALLTSLLNRWSVPGVLRALIFLMLLVQAYGIALLAVVGLIDVWADMRKPRPKREDEE